MSPQNWRKTKDFGLHSDPDKSEGGGGHALGAERVEACTL